MTENKAKTVQINENSLVNLIYDIVERTINERVEKGELTRIAKKPKIRKVQVTESQLRALQAKGVKLDGIKKLTKTK